MHAAVPHDRFAPASPWYRHRWPWLLMLGPLVVVVAGFYTGYLAFARPDALVVDDYYTRGKAINQDLRRDRVASAMGLSMTLGHDVAAGTLRGDIAAKGGTVAGVVQLRLAHATRPEKDLQLLVRPDAQGRFEVPLPFLEAARWRVLAEGEKHEWRLIGDWHWPREATFAVRADAAPSN